MKNLPPLFLSAPRQNFVIAIFGVIALGWSTIGAAFIDGGLEIGSRNAKWSQDGTSTNASSQIIRASGHLDPIPLVPVSFGLGIYSETWKVSEADQGLTSLQSYSVTPEVIAWLPLGDLKPYGRVGYSILSVYTGKAAITFNSTRIEGSIALAGVGLHLGAGLEWSVPMVPFLSITGGLEYSSERVRLAKDKIADIDISSAYTPITLTSTAILFGAKVGF